MTPLLGSIIGTVVTAALTVFIKWLENKQQNETNIVNAVNAATQEAMLISTAQAQAVQHNMTVAASAVPPITNVASAQAAFGVVPKQRVGLPQPNLVARAMVKKSIRGGGQDLDVKAKQLIRSWGIKLLIIGLLISSSGCKRAEVGAVGQYPEIENPPPPQEMFANPEVPLSPREQAGLSWSAALYNRVKVYNAFAIKSNQEHGYYVSTPSTAKRMFE